MEISPTDLNIAAVERDTGLTKDTLRMWERRYGFPKPHRDAQGDRLYPRDQVDKLRIIRRLLDQGMRPSKLVGVTTEELVRRLDECEASAPARVESAIDEDGFMQLVRLHRCNELRAALQQLLQKQGLQRFAAETVGALNVAVGQAWMRGDLDVPEEHLYSEQVQNVLRNAIGAQASGGGRPRILLTTFPDEQHSLGLLMAEAMLVPEGASCVSLGTQTPLADIENAARSNDFDVVALSFSSAFPLRQALQGLDQLRRQLPEGVALWAGGSAFAGKPPPVKGVRFIASLEDAVCALGEWRARHAS